MVFSPRTRIPPRSSSSRPRNSRRQGRPWSRDGLSESAHQRAVCLSCHSVIGVVGECKFTKTSSIAVRGRSSPPRLHVKAGTSKRVADQGGVAANKSSRRSPEATSCATTLRTSLPTGSLQIFKFPLLARDVIKRLHENDLTRIVQNLVPTIFEHDTDATRTHILQLGHRLEHVQSVAGGHGCGAYQYTNMTLRGFN